MRRLERYKTKEELNGISFYKCPGIKVGDVLHYEIPEKIGFKKILKSLIKCVYYSVFSFCDFNQVGVPKTLSLFSNSYRTRNDHRKAFDNVSELIDNQLVVTPARRKFGLSKIKYLFTPLVWVHQMKNTSARFSERIFLSCGALLKAFYDCIDIEKYIKKNKLDIKYLVTYCDVMPVDSYITQYLKNNGIISVTLQHGTFITSSNSWAYLGSKSNYFLAESPFVVDDAKKVGYKGNMIAVGSPHTINSEKTLEPELFKTETIGIIMNTDMLPQEDNISMIKTVQKYCKDNNKKLLIKYHPSNIPSFYEKFIDLSFAKTYKTEISAEKFGDMIDVAVISSSTVFNTMLMEWKPVLLFVRDGHDIGLFSGTDEIKFENTEKLAEKIEIINTPEYKRLLEKYRNYFLCSGDYKENYKNAFREIGII